MSKYIHIFYWLITGTELKNPHFMADSQVDFTGMKNVTYRNWISSSIVLCWYAELEKCVDCFSGSIHNFFYNQVNLYTPLGNY